MSLFGAIGLVLMGIIAANFLAQRYPKIPQAFWQIGMGLLIAFIPGVGQQLIINPDWFLVLIIAPLLFYEGQQTPIKVLSKNFGSIIRLAVVLSIVSVIVVAIAAQQILLWPLPLAFALAAIVTPTDATALNSVTSQVEMPTKLKENLTLESLFNDAVGLVALELALIWLSTGHFSFWSGLSVFMGSAIGGVVVGIVIALILVYIRQHLMMYQLNDMTAQLLLQILSPIFIYMIAEMLHVSAIIAVVIAGVVHNEEREKLQFMSTKFSNLSNQVWTLISHVLNGAVFVLLGAGLVRILVDNENTPWQTLVWMTAVSVILYVTILLVRFIARSRNHHKDYMRDKSIGSKYDHKDAFIFSIGGVHGAMTMAMALSVPFVLDNGEVVPFRDELLFIATTVIVLSLIVPLIVLPRLLPTVTPDYEEEAYKQAHVRMIQAGMKYVKMQDIPQTTKKRLYDHLNRQMGYDQLFERDIWREANNRLAEINKATIQEAMVDEQVSPDALILFKRMMMQEHHRVGMSRVRIMAHQILRRIGRFMERFMNESTREKRQKARIEHFIQFEEERIKHLPVDRQEEMRVLLAKQRDFMHQASEGNWKQEMSEFKRSETERWKYAAEELDNLLAPAVDLEIAQLDQDPANAQLIIAMRTIIERRESNVETAVQSDENEANILFAALQAELNQVIESAANDEIPQEMATTLYGEVTAAQALIMNPPEA